MPDAKDYFAVTTFFLAIDFKLRNSLKFEFNFGLRILSISNFHDADIQLEGMMD